MVDDSRFTAFLFVLPVYDFKNSCVTTYMNIEPFAKLYGKKNIIPYYSYKKNEINLADYFLDYIFLPAPYDEYMPDQFKSEKIVEKIRICYIPYGFNGANNFIELNSKRNFFRNISIDFSPEKNVQEKIKQKFYKEEAPYIHQFYNIGYPSLERYYNKTYNLKLKNILWTPRWSYDSRLGGSHFFEYKNIMLSIKYQFHNIDMVIRPHPLMFQNFVKEGLWKEEDIVIFKKELCRCGIIIDEGGDLYERLTQTDILISDYSSILMPFFLTERPIIYCVHPNIELNDTYKLLMQGMYLAYNKEDVEKYVSMLMKGDDPLRKERIKIKRRIKDVAIGSTARIIDIIAEDYYR